MNLRKRNDAVSEVISIVITLAIVTSSISAILLWGPPAIEQVKLNAQRDATANKIDSLCCDTIPQLLSAGSDFTKIEDLVVEEGSISVDPVGDRLVASYAYDAGYDFTVSGLNDNDITIQMPVDKEVDSADFYWIDDDSTTCFLAGTKVLLSDGTYKNIENVDKGEKVKCYDLENDCVTQSIVSCVHHHKYWEMSDYYLLINNVLSVTTNHLFYSPKDVWIQASNLKVGDYLFDSNLKSYQIFSIERIYNKVNTFDLSIDTFHNYFVNIENGIDVLVHNTTDIYSFDENHATNLWATTPGYIVDSSYSSVGSTTSNGDINQMISTSYTGNHDAYDIISKVELRVYGYYTSSGDAYVIPVFGGSTDGTKHEINLPINTGAWSLYFDITGDKNGPGIGNWDWEDITNLYGKLESFGISGIGPRVYVGMVRIMVTYQRLVPILSFSPTIHDFGEMYEGESDHCSFNIWNSGAGSLSWSVSESVDWITDVSPASGDSTGESDEVTVTVDTTKLEVGSYSGFVSISSNVGNGNFEVILEVIKVPDVPVLSFSPTSYDFGSMYEGESDSCSFEIWNSGSDSLSWSVSWSAGWIGKVDPSSGSSTGEHDTINVFVETAGLSTGIYSDVVRISSDFGSGEFRVDLEIIPVPDVPVLSFSPTSYDFGSMYEGESDSCSFEIWNSGSGTLRYTLSESESWVLLSSYGGISNGDHDAITVNVDTAGLSLGAKSCIISISSDGGGDTFTVSLTVVSEPIDLDYTADPPYYTGDDPRFYTDVLEPYSFSVGIPDISGWTVEIHGWNWGDGNYILSSGSSGSHSWEYAGIYQIIVDFTASKVDEDPVSIFSDPLTIRVIHNVIVPEDIIGDIYTDDDPDIDIPYYTFEADSELEGIVRIDLFDEGYESGNTPFGHVWIFDLGEFRHTIQGTTGEYSSILQNYGIIKVSQNSGYLDGCPRINKIILDGKCSLEFGVMLIRGDISSVSVFGQISSELTLKIKQNYVREHYMNNVYGFKIQIIGDEINKDAWDTYLTELLKDSDGVGTVFTKNGDVLEFNPGPDDSAKLIFSSFIVDITIGEANQ